MMLGEEKVSDPTMDSTTLFLEEVFTDRKVGTLRRLTPVKADGSPDTTREVVFVGQAQFLTPVGALPLSFEIEGKSLADAIANFAPAAKAAFEEALKELRELRREAASSIIVPEMGMPPGPVPGGGKFQLP
jgi:hypothetical protein